MLLPSSLCSWPPRLDLELGLCEHLQLEYWFSASGGTRAAGRLWQATCRPSQLCSSQAFLKQELKRLQSRLPLSFKISLFGSYLAAPKCKVLFLASLESDG